MPARTLVFALCLHAAATAAPYVWIVRAWLYAGAEALMVDVLASPRKGGGRNHA